MTTLKKAAILIATTSMLITGAALAQNKLDGDAIVQSLYGVEAVADINPVLLRQRAIDNVRNNRNPNAMNREPLSEQLNQLRQFTIEINFDFNSAIIRPESYRAIGAMADALHHPYLLGYKFVIIGHTDAKGKRDYNLELSQKRADSVRQALISTFKIAPARLVAIGLGEEQLRDAAHPDADINRRVQLINIGKVGR